jgi:uncharacterized YccA/Bax inhibitor family protein
MSFSNPMLNEKTFASERWEGVMNQIDSSVPKTMTVGGVVNKTVFLFGFCLLGAVVSWMLVEKGIVHAGLLTLIGSLGGFVLSLIVAFSGKMAKWLGAPFALLEGVFVGALSILLNARFEGIVTTAVLITFGVFIGAIIVYRAGWIRLGKTARSILFMAMIGISLTYLASFILGMIPGMNSSSFMAIHKGGVIGIVFSGVVVFFAVMSLFNSIQIVDEGVQSGAPKDFEWVASFGLLSSLVFLYVEILKLLAKLQSRD